MKPFSKAMKAVATLWVVLGVQVCFAAPLQIMPLGDSITQALNDQLSYRY